MRKGEVKLFSFWIMIYCSACWSWQIGLVFHLNFLCENSLAWTCKHCLVVIIVMWETGFCSTEAKICPRPKLVGLGSISLDLTTDKHSDRICSVISRLKYRTRFTAVINYGMYNVKLINSFHMPVRRLNMQRVLLELSACQKIDVTLGCALMDTKLRELQLLGHSPGSSTVYLSCDRRPFFLKMEGCQFANQCYNYCGRSCWNIVCATHPVPSQ